MVQETLQNAVKHADCDNFFVTFAQDDYRIKVFLRDDGQGFTIGKGKTGIGMRNIHSRIHKIGGTVKINSVLGEGTEIVCDIPLAMAEVPVVDTYKIQMAEIKKEMSNSN